MSFNGLPRYACMKCSVVLETPQQMPKLRCPKCGSKLRFLDINVFTRKKMAEFFAWGIFMIGNLIVLGLQFLFMRTLLDLVGMFLFSLLIVGFFYYNFWLGRLFKLAWGKSWISGTIPARRMVDMTYQQAVEKAKMEQPKTIQ